MSFWSISRPRPQNGPMKLPEGRFGAFPSPGRRMGPGSLQKSFYDIFCYPRRGRTHIYDIFCYPKSGRTHIYDIFCYPKSGRTHFYDAFCCPKSARMLPQERAHAYLRHILLPQERAHAYLRHILLPQEGTFWSISKPRPQNGPRKPPESHFGAFPSLGRRMGSGSLQKAILEHFQAQAAE